MRLLNSLIVFLLASLTLVLPSCESDDGMSPRDLQGTWIGCHAYNNPVGGVKKNYLYITFKDGKTGEIEFEGVTSYAYGVFEYRVSGNIIECNGVWASTGDESADTFRLRIEIQGDRLKPIEKYSTFILTRDGSVITDGDGNETIDYSDSIIGVWLSGNQVLELDDDTYTIYNLSSSGSYSSKETGRYTYDYITGILNIGYVSYELVYVDENSMSLRNSSGDIFNLRRGSASDVPDEVNIRDLLTSSILWSTANGRYNFGFFDNGETVYFEHSNKMVGSYGYASLKASGTYSVSGNTVTCYYNSIFWEGGNMSGYANIFPGWRYGGSRTKTYTIYEYSTDRLRIVDSDGGEYIVDKS